MENRLSSAIGIYPFLIAIVFGFARCFGLDVFPTFTATTVSHVLLYQFVYFTAMGRVGLDEFVIRIRIVIERGPFMTVSSDLTIWVRVPALCRIAFRSLLSDFAIGFSRGAEGRLSTPFSSVSPTGISDIVRLTYGGEFDARVRVESLLLGPGYNNKMKWARPVGSDTVEAPPNANSLAQFAAVNPTSLARVRPSYNFRSKPRRCLRHGPGMELTSALCASSALQHTSMCRDGEVRNKSCSFTTTSNRVHCLPGIQHSTECDHGIILEHLHSAPVLFWLSRSEKVARYEYRSTLYPLKRRN